MTDQDQDSGFQVRDRRRRPEEEPSPSVEHRRPSAEPAQKSSPQELSTSFPPAGEPSLVASFALAALEGVRDPASSQVHRDPRQAAEIIDTLMLLRERTEGRRTPEETQALDEILYDLQLRYVRVKTTS
jgi:hypothetical protein